MSTCESTLKDTFETKMCIAKKKLDLRCFWYDRLNYNPPPPPPHPTRTHTLIYSFDCIHKWKYRGLGSSWVWDYVTIATSRDETRKTKKVRLSYFEYRRLKAMNVLFNLIFKKCLDQEILTRSITYKAVRSIIIYDILSSSEFLSFIHVR